MLVGHCPVLLLWPEGGHCPPDQDAAQLDQQPMPVESGRQTGVPLLPPAPETEQGARKDILTELVLLVCVTQPGHGEEEHGEAGLSKAISVS